jgi:hypothetical protein
MAVADRIPLVLPRPVWHHNSHMTTRTCGTCTACCEGWLREKKLDMRPGQPCRHCTTQGCAIYPDRPEEPCRRFECGWLQEENTFPDAMRPDRSGVIVLLDRQWRDWDVILAIPVGRSVPPESLEWLRLHAKDRQRPLIFYERTVSEGQFTGIIRRAFGSARFAEAVRSGIGPEDIVRM